MLSQGIALAGVLVVGVLGTWLVFAALARLGGSAVSWWRPSIGSVPEDDLFDLTRSTSIVMAVIGGVLALLYAYRKQMVDEAAGHRADDEALLGRYRSAADQLGHDQAAVRLAGVYAMSHLADDWPEQRQNCVDVLCAYLRMPVQVEGDELAGELQVRSSVQSVIRSHLLPEAEPSWCNMAFNFTHAQLRGFDLRNAVFATRPNFASATFTDWCSFEGAQFIDGAVFSDCKINGKFVLEPASFGGRIDLVNAQIDSNSFKFECLDTRGEVLMNSVRLRGRAMITLRGPGIASRKVSRVAMSKMRLHGGSVTVKVGGGHGPTTLVLVANNWRTTGETHINVWARAGRGNRPSATGLIRWSLTPEATPPVDVNSTNSHSS